MASRLRKRSLPRRRPAPNLSVISRDERSSKSPSSPRKSARLTGKTEAFSAMVRGLNSGHNKKTAENNVVTKKPDRHPVPQNMLSLPKPVGENNQEILQVFGKTRTEILPSVMALLSDVDRQDLVELCENLNIILVKEAAVYTLEGRWSHLTQIMDAISKKLNSKKTFADKMDTANSPNESDSPYQSEVDEMSVDKMTGARKDVSNDQSGGGDASSIRSDPGDNDGEGLQGSNVIGNIQELHNVHESEKVTDYSQTSGYTLTLIKNPKENPDNETKSAQDSIYQKERVFEEDAANGIESESLVSQSQMKEESIISSEACKKAKKNMRHKLCHNCGKNILNLKRHNCLVAPKPRAGGEPSGNLVEVIDESTSSYTVLMNEEKLKWFCCKSCPMTSSRKHRMEIHYKTSHSEGVDVPYKLIERDDTEIDGEKNGSVSDEIYVDLNGATTNNEFISSESVTAAVEPECLSENCTPEVDPAGGKDFSFGLSEDGGENHDFTRNDTDVTINLRVKRKRGVSRLENNHPEKATEQCERCGFKSSKEGLRNHMQTQHSKYMFSCKVCDKLYPKLFLLRAHYKKNHNSNEPAVNKEFSCDICRRTFKRNVDLVHHKTIGRACSNPTQDPEAYNPPHEDGHYVCVLCSYRAKQRVHVVQHYARKHAPKKFQCDECHVMFAYERELVKHRNISHLAEKIHKCDMCQKSFASPKYLAAHLLRHNKVKKHFCPICKKGFLEKFRLTNHFETHKDKTDRLKSYSCKICSKMFTSVAYLRDHENIHSGKEPYSCKICGKTMKLQSSVWKHMQYHKAEKSFVCPHPPCKRSFRFKSALQAHKVTHTGDGKNKCENCGKVYTQKQTLLRHICKKHVTELDQSKTSETEIVSLNNEEASGIEDHTLSPHEVYMCTECEKLFSEWKEVEAHMLWHASLNESEENVAVTVTNVEQSEYGDEVCEVVNGEREESKMEEILRENTTRALAMECQEPLEPHTKVYSLVMNPDGNDAITLQEVDSVSGASTNNVVIQSVNVNFDSESEESVVQGNPVALTLDNFRQTENMMSVETMGINIDVDSYPTASCTNEETTMLSAPQLQVDGDPVHAPVITIVETGETGSLAQNDVIIGHLNREQNIGLMEDLVTKDS